MYKAWEVVRSAGKLIARALFVTLILGEATLTAASEPLGQACGLFAAGGLPSRCRVQSRVPPGLFWLFLKDIQGKIHPNYERKRFRAVAAVRRVWLLELVFEVFGISRLSLVQRCGGRRSSKPVFRMRRTVFAAGAAACGARSEAVAARADSSGARADASGSCARDLQSPDGTAAASGVLRGGAEAAFQRG
jgi:hypothetical protein